MAESYPEKNAENEPQKGIVFRNISTEMRESYLDYAMSVITSRALPDVRDGLKPVHRRILYAMHVMGLTANAKSRKSAAVVGEVLGKYHPHGDAAVYDSMVQMAQEFKTRYPLVLGQGNFGSVDGDSAAAMRYTEAKMSRLSGELLRDIEKDTVDWHPNYDGTHQEPWVMPGAVPNLLLNGTLGIAVGMATNIPPHNLREIADATNHLIDHPDATTEDLLQFVKGPDFPTGGIAFGSKDIAHAYASGRGGVVVRGEAEIVEGAARFGGSFQIIVTSLPYRVNKAELIGKIAEMVKEKKLEGIKALRDESTKDMRIAIDLKAGTQPQAVLNYLYKHTELESVFHYNMLALVGGIPQTLSLKTMLAHFIDHRHKVVRRRTEYDLRKAEERAHILEGLTKALDHIDEVIALIKRSKDTPAAHANLMKEFGFSDRQAAAILEMRLSKLAGLERKQLEDELKEKHLLIKELQSILASPKKLMGIIRSELEDIALKYGDNRKTKIVKGGVKNISVEDLIPDEETILVLTKGGYIKRTNPSEYRQQRRGGVGVVDLDTKEEDFIVHLMTASTHADVLFFTDRGKAYQIKMYELPEGKRATRGKSLMNFLALSEGEQVTSILAMPKEVRKADKLGLVMITSFGTIKKSSADSFKDVRRNGIIAITLTPGDKLLCSAFTESGDEIILVTSRGQSIRFKESQVREMGRTAGGVRGIRLGKKDDAVVGADIIKKGMADPEIMVMSEKGFGKKTKLNEYKTQSRGGSGIKTANVTDKTGKIMVSKVIGPEEKEVVAISRQSQVIRIAIDEVPSLGRSTQGVRIMKLRSGDSIASLICL